MNNTEEKISEIKLMSTIMELDGKENLSDADIVSFIGEVQSLTSEYRKKFYQSKTEDTTIESCEDAADMIIDLAHTAIVTSINSFELPELQLKKMKKQFYKTIISKSEFLNETFSWSFTIQFWNNHLKSKKAKTSRNN